MLFRELTLDEAMEISKKDGFDEGKAEGEMLMLVKLICRKLEKDKTTKQIAEELEETPELIQEICEIAKKQDNNAEKICRELMKAK